MSTSAILARLGTLLDRTPPFDQLSADQRADLLADISLQLYETGDVILEQNSTQRLGLFIVESGLVRLMDIEAQRLLDKCGEGDVFGSFGLLKGGSAIYEAKAVEPTVCAVLSVERFQRLYDENEEFAAFFDQDLRQYMSRIGTSIDVAGAHVLLTQRLYQLVHREPVTCDGEMPAQQAARMMKRESVGALVVTSKGILRGILTGDDLRDKLVAAGKPLDTPVKRLMTAPVPTISDGARVLDAMLMMLDKRAYHLVITRAENDREVPVGLISDRDLAHFRGQDPLATLQRIDQAASTNELARVRADAHGHLLNLYRQGLQPESLNAVISTLYDRLMIRVLYMVERDMRAAADEVRIDLPWTWVRLGSGGRRETGLSSEKYGALVYANPATEDAADAAQRWFDRLYQEANAALEACGFQTSADAAPGFERCHSLRAWKKIYRTWIFETDAAALAPVAPFFDMRSIYGDATLFEALRLDIEDALNVQAMDGERDVLAMLANQALDIRPPLSFFRRFVLDHTGEERPAFNIRDRGIRPVVALARVLALDLRYIQSSATLDRLRHAVQSIPDMAEELQRAIEAYIFLVDFRLAHQLRKVEANEPLDNQIDPAMLTKVQRNLLRNAFGAVSSLQEAVARRYHISRKWFS